MRRAYFLLAVTLALAFPASAAEKPPVTPPKLVARIDSLFATKTGGKVVIQVKGADDVDYQSMINVLDALQQLDITKVGLATE